MKDAGDWIRTLVLWSRKRPRYQLELNFTNIFQNIKTGAKFILFCAVNIVANCFGQVE